MAFLAESIDRYYSRRETYRQKEILLFLFRNCVGSGVLSGYFCRRDTVYNGILSFCWLSDHCHSGHHSREHNDPTSKMRPCQRPAKPTSVSIAELRTRLHHRRDHECDHGAILHALPRVLLRVPVQSGTHGCERVCT